jgi:hypothetical protein
LFSALLSSSGHVWGIGAQPEKMANTKTISSVDKIAPFIYLLLSPASVQSEKIAESTHTPAPLTHPFPAETVESVGE